MGKDFYYVSEIPMSNVKIAALRALHLMDLTTLSDNDTDDKIIELCKLAKTFAGNTAGICIYPRFIPIAKKQLRSQGTPIFEWSL